MDWLRTGRYMLERLIEKSRPTGECGLLHTDVKSRVAADVKQRNFKW